VYDIPSARRDVLAAAVTYDPNEDWYKFKTEDDLYAKQAIVARSWKDPDPERTSDVFRGMIENVTTGVMRLSDAVSRGQQELGNIIGL